jgi:vacuolar-type H+-ATPase subunit F/Vma7
MPGDPPREVVAIGTEALIAGFALVGVRLAPAVSAAEVRVAWQRAHATAGVVILTPAAAEVLAQDRTALHAPLTVVMPP